LSKGGEETRERVRKEEEEGEYANRGYAKGLQLLDVGRINANVLEFFNLDVMVLS
jgi:hypothetical protein